MNSARLIGYPGHDLLLPDIVRAKNCHLYDAGGNAYLDLESGVWCTCIGHGNPAVLEALTTQAGTLAHAGFSYSSAVVEQAAAAFLDQIGFSQPAGGKCMFLCSGSEAVEYGLRLARQTPQVSEKPLILTMADSYSGAYGAVQAKAEGQWHLLDWTPCAACDDDVCCTDDCPTWRALPLERIGAFLFEPGSSAGQVRFPPAKLITSICSALHAQGGLILANEVTTGFGRSGEWFGYQHYGIEPDMVFLGKGIGNGYPVSLCAVSPRAMGRLGGQTVPYAQSHQNDPLGAAVALAVLRYIQEHELIERAKTLSGVLLSGLDAIAAETGCVAEVRGRGLMAAVELKGDPQLAPRVQRQLLQRGYLVGNRPGINTLRFDPALTMAEEDLVSFLAALREVLTTVRS